MTPFVFVAFALAAPPAECGFPKDSAVLNAKLDLGAKADGTTDDTDALQKGIDQSCGFNARVTKALFLPNGTYRVTRTLVVKNGLGPWMYGESRDGVVIKLDDGVANCTSVLRTHPNDSGDTSADWFMRNFRNFTLDVGNNPNTDGIRYHATNSGILKNLRVTGRGKIGIHSGFVGKSGPNLIQDCVIDGFETGIQSNWIWGQTLSRVTIRDCVRVGLVVCANVVAAEDLKIENTPLAVECSYPNDWGHWGGVLAIAGGTFTTNRPSSGPAVRNASMLYARDIVTKGYAKAIDGKGPAGDAAGPNVGEYASHGAKKLFPGPDAALKLPVKPEPACPWEFDFAKWECVNDHGAVPGDGKDDTAAIQKAIDVAAATGKTTVFFRGCGGGDPNGFDVSGEIRVHGSVRLVTGLGWARLLQNKTGGFVVDDESAPVVKFQNIDAFGGTPITIENRSAKSSLVIESCGVGIVGSGTGDIFATDAPCLLDLRKPGQKAWCRQLNPEGKSDIGLVRNAGSDLWILGMKCEDVGVRVRTAAGGRTEILGSFIYGPGLKEGDKRPIFDVEDASLSVLGLREICFGGHCYFVKVREKRGTETKTLGVETEGGWIGWSAFQSRPAGK